MKPQILLIPDRTLWIIGDIAQQIKKYNTDYNFIIISRQFIEKHPSLYKKLLQKVDLVHLLTPYNCSSLLKDSKCPTVTTLHHCITDNIGLIKGINDNHKIIVLANEWKEFLISLGCSPEKIKIIPNGIDINYYVPFSDIAKKNLRIKNGINPNKFVIGFFGKETSDLRKGTDVLLKAIKILNQKSYTNQFCLVLTGIVDEEFTRKLIKTDISVVNLGYLNNKSSLLEAYQLIDCYLITSRIEGGPYPLLEAMSCNVPVISTPVGMAKDIIRNRQNGILIPQDRPDLVVEALIDIKKNYALRKKIIREAMNDIGNKLTWEKTVSKLSPIYNKSILKRKSNTFSQQEIKYFEKESQFLDRIQWLDELKKIKNLKVEIIWILNIFVKWPFRILTWRMLLKIVRSNIL